MLVRWRVLRANSMLATTKHVPFLTHTPSLSKPAANSDLTCVLTDEYDQLMVRVLHTVAHVCAASSGVGSDPKKAGGGAELSAAECATTVSALRLLPLNHLM